MKKILWASLTSLSVLFGAASCTPPATRDDINKTQEVGNTLAKNQPTPTDFEYSLERYNLIRRAYWVNGQKEKAKAVERPTEVPMGYAVLFTESGNVVGQFAVDGISNANVQVPADGAIYTLQGIKVEGKPQPGIYVKNGRKIVVKWLLIEN